MGADGGTLRLRRLTLAGGHALLCLAVALLLLATGLVAPPAALRPDPSLPALESFARALALHPWRLYRDLMLLLLPGHLVAAALATADKAPLAALLGLELLDADDRPADTVERLREALCRLVTPITLGVAWAPLLLLGSGRSLSERLSRTHWSNR